MNKREPDRQPRVLDIHIFTISHYDTILIVEDVINLEIPVIIVEAILPTIGSFKFCLALGR